MVSWREVLRQAAEGEVQFKAWVRDTFRARGGVLVHVPPSDSYLQTLARTVRFGLGVMGLPFNTEPSSPFAREVLEQQGSVCRFRRAVGWDVHRRFDPTSDVRWITDTSEVDATWREIPPDSLLVDHSRESEERVEEPHNDRPIKAAIFTVRGRWTRAVRLIHEDGTTLLPLGGGNFPHFRYWPQPEQQEYPFLGPMSVYVPPIEEEEGREVWTDPSGDRFSASNPDGGIRFLRFPGAVYWCFTPWAQSPATMSAAALLAMEMNRLLADLDRLDPLDDVVVERAEAAAVVRVRGLLSEEEERAEGLYIPDAAPSHLATHWATTVSSIIASRLTEKEALTRKMQGIRALEEARAVEERDLAAELREAVEAGELLKAQILGNQVHFLLPEFTFRGEPEVLYYGHSTWLYLGGEMVVPSTWLTWNPTVWPWLTARLPDGSPHPHPHAGGRWCWGDTEHDKFANTSSVVGAYSRSILGFLRVIKMQLTETNTEGGYAPTWWVYGAAHEGEPLKRMLTSVELRAFDDGVVTAAELANGWQPPREEETNGH